MKKIKVFLFIEEKQTKNEFVDTVVETFAKETDAKEMFCKRHNEIMEEWNKAYNGNIGNYQTDKGKNAAAQYDQYDDSENGNSIRFDIWDARNWGGVYDMIRIRESYIEIEDDVVKPKKEETNKPNKAKKPAAKKKPSEKKETK